MNPGSTPNRLILSSSPYLLQHAFNPVDWYEWGQEALDRAQSENKPILISIGYSACHWCHVMERECFENKDIAALMNEYFVCIKVDREERPDLDHVYMDAVQAMGINGGWPLNVFLTPDRLPFFGGTYFPPQRWSGILIKLNKVFHGRRAEIESSAIGLRDHLNSINSASFAAGDLDNALAERMVKKIATHYDREFGGLDKAPKFIMPSIWQFLLRYQLLTHDEKVREMVTNTLLKICCGGIYDQIGGGFARYSVDERWLAPHFEKMLYDNAQLISLYTEAWQVTHVPAFKQVTEDTISFLFRELRHPDGAFYSALDADSEGEEGKFYCWTAEQLKLVSGDRADRVMDYFHASEEGNWEGGKNILLGRADVPQPDWLPVIREKLLQQRDTRIRPGLDDKIIFSWNALTIKGLAEAGLALGRRDWIDAGLTAYEFLSKNLIFDKKIRRSFKGKAVGHEGFLDDYAAWINCLFSLHQATMDIQFLLEGIEKIEYVLDSFLENDIYFNYTSRYTEQLITPTRELFDNVIPSSNAMMCQALLRGAELTGNQEWKSKAVKMLIGRREFMASSPAYHAAWGVAFLEYVNSNEQVVIIGEDAVSFRMELAKPFKPFTVFTGSTGSIPAPAISYPLFNGRHFEKNVTRVFVCRNQACQYPVMSVSDALSLLGSE